MTYLSNYANLFNNPTWTANAQSWLKSRCWNFYTENAVNLKKAISNNDNVFYGNDAWIADKSKTADRPLLNTAGFWQYGLTSRLPKDEGTPDSASSGPGRGNNAASGQGNGGGTSGLHQFVTRYTIERPEDPSRSGIEICLEGDDISDPIIEVECGGNKGLLYVTKLCQGSKGQSILFNDEWLTPNEFQFISGRETAKDWKRSIRHCGKSLKTLMTKGILLVHPPVCECDYCKGHGPALAEKVVKKRSYVSSHDRQISNPENARSGGSTTPSSTESTTPIPSGLSEPLSLPLHKMTGREGLNSIISQLHNKKAVSGNDVLAGSEEGSLDLTVRPSSRSSPSNINGRKRRREPGLKNFMNNRHEEQFAPMKRRNSNENDCKNPFPVSSEDQTQSDKYERNYTMPNSNPSEILCLTSDSKGTDNSKERCYSNHCPKSENKSNSEYNGICDLSQSSRDYKNQHGRKNLSSVSSPSNPALPDYYGAHRGYRPGMGFNDYALLDAMKRAVAGVYGDRVRTPPSSSLPRRMLSSSPHSARGGFINLGSTSRKSETSSHSSLRDPPMVELTSPHSKMIGSRSFEHYDYGSHRNSYNHHHLSHHKAPVTVLQHSSQYDNPLMPGHRQSAPDTPHTHHYYAMPPPHHSFHSDRRVNSRSHSDRNKRNSSMAANRFDKKYRQGKSGNRKSASVGTSTYAHSDVGLLNGREHRMVDLHNHAIPMVSLTYTKKRASKKSDEKDVESRTCNGTRNTDSSPPALNTKHRALRAVASDDEISRSGDMLRRLSSSAPPPPRFFNVNGDGDGKVDENNNFRESRSAKEAKDDVFRYNRPRAKSASPNASRSHPYFDGSRGQRSTSSLDAFCQSSENSCYPDSPFDNVASVQQQYEMLRWRDFSSAIEAMGEWSVDGVCEFLHKIGCQQYEETFRENGIDGDALPLLMEHHLVNKMGLKLGHALKVIARVHRRLGNHCALISDRFSLLRSPVSNYRNSTNSALMDSPNIFSQMNGIQEQDEKEES